MEPSTEDTLEDNLGDVLQDELSKPSETYPSTFGGSKAADTERPSRRIPGGFSGLAGDLERRVRDWSNMLRVLEQERPQVEAAQAKYAASRQSLARVVAEAQEAGQVLEAMLEKTMAGDVSEDLGVQFTKNLEALDELESVAQALTANLLWIRSSWEQYARSIIRAQKMREKMPLDPSER